MTAYYTVMLNVTARKATLEEKELSTGFKANTPMQLGPQTDVILVLQMRR